MRFVVSDTTKMSNPPPATATRPPTVDGRRLRSERTRQVIIDAYLGLLRRNPAMPTAAEIAKAAGYSVRSIFKLFADLNALTLATADHAILQGQAEAQARDVDADRATRIRSHVHNRAAACEKWSPLWRILMTTQQEVGELKQRIVLARYANIERMKLMYAPELAVLEEAPRQSLLIALATLVSFESWDQMRDCYKLSIEDAESTWRTAIGRLLPATPAGSR